MVGKVSREEGSGGIVVARDKGPGEGEKRGYTSRRRRQS